MTTIREHAEAILRRHQYVKTTAGSTSWWECSWCKIQSRPCPDAREAQAILDALNNAERATTWFNDEAVEHLRLVPDPGASS